MGGALRHGLTARRRTCRLTTGRREPREMASPPTAARRIAFGVVSAALASTVAYAQQVHGEAAAADSSFAPEPEPAPDVPPPPPVYPKYWHLTIADTIYFLLTLFFAIIIVLFLMYHCCCGDDPEQPARYAKLVAERKAREAAEGLSSQAAPYGRKQPEEGSSGSINRGYSDGGQSRPYAASS